MDATPVPRPVQTVTGPAFARATVHGVHAEAGTPVDSWVFKRAPFADPPVGRVVVVHGLGDAPPTWFPALRHAFPRHEIVLPAIPGMGRGPLPPGLDHLTFRATAAWLHGLLLDLADENIPTRVVGHSLGGWLLERAYLADPALARAFGPPVLVNNAGTWYDGVERERALLSPESEADVQRLLEHLYAHTPTIPREALSAMFTTMRSPAYRGLLWSTVREDFLSAADLCRLPPRTGIVWGIADRLVPAAAFATLRASIPEARVRELACGHAPHLEAPGRLVTALSDLLEVPL